MERYREAVVDCSGVFVCPRSGEERGHARRLVEFDDQVDIILPQREEQASSRWSSEWEDVHYCWRWDVCCELEIARNHSAQQRFSRSNSRIPTDR